MPKARDALRNTGGTRVAREATSWLLAAALTGLLAACADGGGSLRLAVQDPFVAPADPLAEASLAPCPIYGEERCVDGTLEVCSVYDTGAGAFTAPSELFERVLHYERWYELYSSPHGLSAERVFNAAAPGDLPEEVWSSADHFLGWRRLPDSAIWTGAALNGRIGRYLVTGTESDYLLMEQTVRDLLRLFELTRIKGYLARHFFLEVPAEAPRDGRSLIRTEGLPPLPKPYDHTFHVLERPEEIEGLPAMLSEGYVDPSGTVWEGTPMWRGTPTIDQMSGMTTTVAAAFGLLGDDDLKARVAEQMTCYLNRLQRLDLVNLQENPEFMASLTAILQRGATDPHPHDVDVMALERATFYYTLQPNSLNTETYDRSCPSGPMREPARILDAASPAFELEALALVLDLDGKFQERQTGIDHYYVPNVRGQDAVHLMNLAAMAYYFTGDETYRSFFDDILVDELDAPTVARSFLSVKLPKWCRQHFEVHISVPPAWAFLNQLADSPLKTAMQQVMYEDVWLRDTKALDNAKFSWMMAGPLPASIAPDRLEVGAHVAAQLATLGGNDGILDAPRRSYTVTFEEMEARLPPDITAECPTQAQVDACEAGVTIFGITMEAAPITTPCTGAPGECEMADGCVPKMASAAIPVKDRVFAGHLWNHNPYQMQDHHDLEGAWQSAGTDLIESYWWARYYGFITEDDGHVLAWHETATCE